MSVENRQAEEYFLTLDGLKAKKGARNFSDAFRLGGVYFTDTEKYAHGDDSTRNLQYAEFYLNTNGKDSDDSNALEAYIKKTNSGAQQPQKIKKFSAEIEKDDAQKSGGGWHETVSQEHSTATIDKIGPNQYRIKDHAATKKIGTEAYAIDFQKGTVNDN